MARNDANKGYDNHGIIEPGYGGRSRAIFNYAATSESRVRTEQLVEYGSFPVSHYSTKKYGQLLGDNQLFGPWDPIHHDGPQKGRKSSPKFSRTQGSPHKNILHRDNSPPSRGQYHHKNFSSNESDDDNEDDVVDEKDYICENGVCSPKPKHMREKDYERAKARPNSYDYETSYNPHFTYTDKPKDDTYSYSPPSYTHYPRPIKTRPDHTTTYQSPRNSPVGAQRSPFSTSSPRSPFTSSPGKDHETIDSRRYGKVGSPRVGAMGEQYRETIDCREAAKKYHGVLLNY